MVLSDGLVIGWEMAIHIDGAVLANENGNLLREKEKVREQEMGQQ